MKKPLVSIVVNNYNYAHFLKRAIDSALSQTYTKTEVLVIDDGSTDNSREVIASYGDRIIPVLKENEGQISTVNAGIANSNGSILIFVDADDALIPTAIENAVPLFRDEKVVKVHWPLLEMNSEGSETGKIIPEWPMADGDLKDEVIANGPLLYVTSPTTGNAWSKKFLDQIYPLQELGNKHGADAYLSTVAPLYGSIKTIHEPLGFYRVHETNFSGNKRGGKRHPHLFRVQGKLLKSFLQKMNIPADIDIWEKQLYNWEYDFVNEIETLIDPQSKFILVDDNQIHHGLFKSSNVYHFPEKDGEFTGLPANSDQAIEELERLRYNGAIYMVFISSSFWWLNHYKEFIEHLSNNYEKIHESETLLIYNLR